MLGYVQRVQGQQSYVLLLPLYRSLHPIAQCVIIRCVMYCHEFQPVHQAGTLSGVYAASNSSS